MRTVHAISSGATGAAVLTLAHEIVRQLVPRAPRMDKLGMEGLVAIMKKTGMRPPRGERLRGWTLVGDLVVNSLYFAPIAASRHVSLARGAIVGALAGVGALVLTPVLGLSRRHRGLTTRTQLLTVGLYAVGGIAAAAMGKVLRQRSVVTA